MSLAILLLAVLAVLAGVQFTRTEGTDAGCGGVRTAYERASFVERSGDVPTERVYREAGAALRQAAIDAPPAGAQHVRAVADAYVRLGSLLQGFDPDDESTYHVIEDNAAAIDAQQTVLDEALPELRGWLESRCG